MKKIIALIYGGRSEEHDISVKSAKNVEKNIDRTLFDIVCFRISKEGQWSYTGKEVVDDLRSKAKVFPSISLDFSKNKARFLTSTGDFLKVDIAFPVLHGPNGEDGRIQGLFQIAQIPFIGVDVLGASITMDKMMTKKILEHSGLPIVPYIHCLKSEFSKSELPNVSSIGYPCIVKPVNLGSSIGVTKVEKPNELAVAMENAFSFDNELLIESFIDGRELEIAVLQTHEVEASSPGEIVMEKDYAFYDFESKYEDPDAVSIQIPAKVTAAQTASMKKMAIKAFKAAKVRHFCRIDLFLSHKGDIYINEINAIPGFTNSSMFPSLCKTIGYEYPSLLTHLFNLSS